MIKFPWYVRLLVSAALLVLVAAVFTVHPVRPRPATIEATP